MTDSLYLRLKSLNVRTMRGVTSPKSVIRVAAMHNLREIQAELGASAASGINPARMHMNYQLRGPATADEVASLALALLDNAGVQALRRDACMALELVVSLPANTAIDHREYFAAAVTWADAHFNVPILSAAVHLDEAAPHCHILLLPLVAGRMQGGALAGGPAKIRAMLADFQQVVAQRFGLAHQPRAKRLSKPNRDAAGRMVLQALCARPESLSEPAMRDALAAALGSQAETLLALLGLSMPATKANAKSFADIMTAPCKPEHSGRARKSIDVAPSKSIDVGGEPRPEIQQRLCSVDVAPPAQHFQHAAARPEPTTSDDPQPVHPAAQDVQNVGAPTAEDALKTEPTVGASIEAPESVFSPQHRQRADNDRQQPASSTAAPVKSKTGEPGNATAPGGRAVRSKVRFSDFDTATTGRCSNPSITAHELDRTDAPASASPQTDAHNRQWVANPRHQDGYQRQRDTDYPATCWDVERGEFVPATGPP